MVLVLIITARIKSSGLFLEKVKAVYCLLIYIQKTTKPYFDQFKIFELQYEDGACNLPDMTSDGAGTLGVFTGKIGVDGRDREAKNLSGFSGLIR